MEVNANSFETLDEYIQKNLGISVCQLSDHEADLNDDIHATNYFPSQSKNLVTEIKKGNKIKIICSGEAGFKPYGDDNFLVFEVIGAEDYDNIWFEIRLEYLINAISNK